MIFRKRFLALLFIVVIASCAKKDQSVSSGQSCPYIIPSTVAPAAEVTYLQNYLSSRSITATKDTSGLFYNIDSIGSGTVVPTVCSAVTIAYVGNLLSVDNSNAQFDANTNVTFALGDLITGWIKGISLIRKGGSITLYIPPTLAYGSTPRTDNNGVIVIPANSYLKFKIQLFNLQ